MCSRKMWNIRGVLFIVGCALLAKVNSQVELDELDADDPCNHANTINLPTDGKCLVPIKKALGWVAAQATCERAGGSLYESPDARLQSRPQLMRCLASMSDPGYDDMWINAVGLWSPHFYWINGTWVNKVDYCTREPIPKEDTSGVPIKSATLSVDYCVSTCHDSGARFIVLHKNNQSPECYCRHELDAKYMQPCYRETFDYDDETNYYVVHAKEDSLIKLASSDAFSSTEILCATVDATTKDKREMNSDTCFTKRHFICCLGEAEMCTNTQCSGVECRFIMRDKCMLRVALNYNWYAARAYCTNLGGDLWNMHELNEMNQVTQFLDGVSRYWIGATNYAWTFNGSSTQLTGTNGDFNLARCGHMFRERTSTLGTWQWGDTVCDQQKSFICQFDRTTFTAAEIGKEVSCPWPIVVEPVTTGGTVTPGPVTGDEIDDSFPLAAVIAAIVAGIVLLTCLGLAFAFCNRNRWAAGKAKAREHLAFIPYFADVPVADYESHAAMSSVSDHGSQVGLIKNGYQANGFSSYNMSQSYGEQSGMFSNKSLDRKSKEAMDRKLAESQNYLVSGNSSMDERGFAATYSTMSNKARDYMTLQAQMDIKDDAELAAMRASFRGKPEVALVTDNVDMNFTVNHAVSRSHSHAGSEMSRSSLERTMEEITLPATEGGMGLNLPERVTEEAKIYSNMTATYSPEQI